MGSSVREGGEGEFTQEGRDKRVKRGACEQIGTERCRCKKK
jgi:hypothetical protein